MIKDRNYEFSSFITDIQTVFSSTTNGLSRAEGIRKHLCRLMTVPDWLEAKLNLPTSGGFGSTDLYVDDEYGHPDSGFLVMCSVMRPGQGQTPAPHDHGASWVVYGVYRGTIEQRTFRWVYPGQPTETSPVLEQTDSFEQREGEAAYFLPGEIHSPRNVLDERAIVLRIEAQQLTGVWRHRYGQDNTSLEAFRSGP